MAERSMFLSCIRSIAYDEAGNIGYYATYIITVDLASMRVTLEPLDIYATLNN